MCAERSGNESKKHESDVNGKLALSHSGAVDQILLQKYWLSIIV